MSERKRQPWRPLLCSLPDSRKVNQLSFEAETMYTRLLARADDGGNYDAEPILLVSGLFARRVKAGQIDVSDAARMRDELVTVGLACLYEADGEMYLHLNAAFRILRKDVKRDIRFPTFAQDLVVAGLPEHGPDPGRTRAERGPDDGPPPARTRAPRGEEKRKEENINPTARKNRTTTDGKVNWLAVRHRVDSQFPGDRGVDNFVRWLSLELLPRPAEQVQAAVDLLWALFDKAEEKDRPAAWLMGAVKQPVHRGGFGYRPIGCRSPPAEQPQPTIRIHHQQQRGEHPCSKTH